MARITCSALSVFIYAPNGSAEPLAIFSMLNAKVAPSSSNTIDTVVDVGMPSELKMSSSTTSVTITARNTSITSPKTNCSGRMMPWRAMSIMPSLITAPQNTPTAATVTIVRNRATFEPMAELRKLTASLLTPTQRSNAARIKRNAIIPKYIHSII